MVEDGIMELAIMPELLIIIEVSIAELDIMVDVIMPEDIMSLDIIVSDIIVSDIMESDSIVSVMSAAEDIIDIVTVEALVFVVDWAAARALRVQTITVIKCMLNGFLFECVLWLRVSWVH